MKSLKHCVCILVWVCIFCFGLAQENYSSFSAYRQGVELYHQQKYESALFFLEKAFQTQPLNVNLCFYLGNIYNRKKLFGKAIESYVRGLEISSEAHRPALLMNLGLNYQANGQYKEALQVYSMLEKEYNWGANLYLQKGLIFFKLRNKEKLMESWELYLAKDPRNPQYKNIRAVLDVVKDEAFRWEDQVDNSELARNLREENKELLDQKSEQPQSSFTDQDIQLAEQQLLQELQNREGAISAQKLDQEVEKSILSARIDSEDLKLQDMDMQEGVLDDEIER